MKLSREEVVHFANLARLRLTTFEEQQYTEQLSDILDYVTKLEELDTQSIPPTSSIFQTNLRLREDDPRPGLPQEVILRDAPETKDGQFKVPPVLGQ